MRLWFPLHTAPLSICQNHYFSVHAGQQLMRQVSKSHPRHLSGGDFSKFQGRGSSDTFSYLMGLRKASEFHFAQIFLAIRMTMIIHTLYKPGLELKVDVIFFFNLSVFCQVILQSAWKHLHSHYLWVKFPVSSLSSPTWQQLILFLFFAKLIVKRFFIVIFFNYKRGSMSSCELTKQNSS